MRLFTIISFILFGIFTITAQRQEFQPTIDIGLNGGILLADYNNNKGKLKAGGLSLMANTGFNRHILEFDMANSINEDGLEYDLSGDIQNPINRIKPTALNLNYTFAREVFAYYPACMIRNQLLLGLRLNAEIFMGNALYTDNNNSTIHYSTDYGRYSADFTLITDYHLNKTNYLVLQLYTPIISYFARPFEIAQNNDRPLELDDRLDASKSWFFDNGQLGWLNEQYKLGANITYRVLLSDKFALQLKYNGKLKSRSQVDMTGNLTVVDEVEENYHQIMFGVVGHIIRPPIGF